MVNQSLLEDLLCLRRVVVPTARCFSSDSYGGSVISRSTDSPGRSRSQATASCVDSSNGTGVTTTSVSRWDASFYDAWIVAEGVDSPGHTHVGRPFRGAKKKAGLSARPTTHRRVRFAEPALQLPAGPLRGTHPALRAAYFASRTYLLNQSTVRFHAS